MSKEAECSDAGATYQGDDSKCSPNPCEEAPECPGDLNGDGSVGFGDLTDLLNMWGPCPE